VETTDLNAQKLVSQGVGCGPVTYVRDNSSVGSSGGTTRKHKITRVFVI
jgi:hypothetical protein